MAHLPMSRTKTIMKTTDGADAISKEAVILTTRAAELFIKELALAGVQNLGKEKRLNYINLVNVVHSKSKYEFLEYMIPKKITVKEYNELMRKKNDSSSDSSEDGTSTSSSSSSGSGSDSGSEELEKVES